MRISFAAACLRPSFTASPIVFPRCLAARRAGAALPLVGARFASGAAASGAAAQKQPRPSKAADILALNQKLLDYISAGDWAGYASLCCPRLTCFEPEARGALVEGLPFHKIYYDRPAPGETKVSTMSAPHVRFLAKGAVALVNYVRLVQGWSEGKGHATARVEETRVWERAGSSWLLVHFHKSDLEKK